MANTIRHKRGTGDPVAGDFSETAELLVNTSDGGLFTKTDGGSVVEIGGGGGGTVTSVDSGTGLTGGPITTSGTLSLADTAVTPGSYTVVSLTVDAQGRVTAASSGTAGISDTSTSATSIGLGPLALADESSGYDNTAVGSGAAESITTGRGNSAFGEHALANATTGIFNTIVGHDSSWGITIGSRNTCVGYFSLRNCVSGSGNVAIGNDALQIATGSNNVAVGNQAGDQITTGVNNTCIGYEAQPSSGTVSNEITLGRYTVTKFRVPGINFTLKDNAGTPTEGQVLTADSSGEGYWADAGGASSLNDLSDAQSNNTFSVALGANAGGALPNFTAAVGVGALASTSSTAGGNSALGFIALNSCTTGAGNTAIGYEAAKNLTTGDNNIAIGREAMDSCGANPSDNIAIGRVALQDVTGDSNTCIGALSGTQITTGVNNVCVGKSSGTILTTGTNNVFIGGNAGDSTTGSNNVCIGDNADPTNGTVSNSVTLGNSSITALRCAVQTISSLSDGRDKTNVQELPEGLAFIDSLNPVKFQWQTREGIPKDGTYEAGFIAQDLQSAQTASNADYLGLVMDENPERLEASYGKLVPMLVKAIQELKSEVEQLKANA